MIVLDPADWPWSSCRAMVALEPPPRFLDLVWLEQHFGLGARDARRRYRDYVRLALAAPPSPARQGHVRGQTPDTS